MSKHIHPNDKGYTTRKTNQLAGARIALPGQPNSREAELRADLIADFKPTNIPEKIWIGDLAHCMAAIEVKRAQIAGFYQVRLRETAREIVTPNVLHNPEDPLSPAPFSHSDFTKEERDAARFLVTCNFRPCGLPTLLDREEFAVLIGSLTAGDAAQLRQLEAALHETMRERDRIINQIERRRQQALRDAIALAEERRRARAAGDENVDGVGSSDATRTDESAVDEDDHASGSHPTDPLTDCEEDEDAAGDHSDQLDALP